MPPGLGSCRIGKVVVANLSRTSAKVAQPMEYLVNMTTHVPGGTPDEAVAEVREREAAHSRELAAEGRLLRLWRPPLQPGEWRTLGLFDAANSDQLEEVLASMPLRVWRTDDVTPLSPHPNDPDLSTSGGGTEFLTTFTITFPEDTPRQTVADIEAREATRAKELAGQGHLQRLWLLPGESRALGLWTAGSTAEMQTILASLPMDPWMTVQTIVLARHPTDPGANRSRS
jgi:muconolactone delta-isomerase